MTAPQAKPKLRLGTRRSPLAMAQAEEARARLCAAHGWTEAEVELVAVTASGDKVQDRPLAEIGGKALWTKELDGWLASGRIDAAVHSMKDVETIRPKTIAFGAILPRADVRDCLLGAPSLDAIPKGARLGTCAPRRAAQLLSLRPDCKIVPMRGNVATRMSKLESGECDITMLAAAGLARLGMSDVGASLALEEWLPAAAQGAIGIECRSGDDATKALLEAIDDEASRIAVLTERAVLAGLGGTCHSPVAMRSELKDSRVRIWVSLFSADGSERLDNEVLLNSGDWAEAQKFGQQLVANAPDAIRSLFATPSPS